MAGSSKKIGLREIRALKPGESFGIARSAASMRVDSKARPSPTSSSIARQRADNAGKPWAPRLALDA